MIDREVRAVLLTPEVREGDNGPPRIVGHAAVFDQWSELLPGRFRERISKGAFADTLRSGADVLALFNHNTDAVLGRTSAGTLRAVEDETGLLVEIDPPDTSLGRDLLVSIRRGDVKGMSFAFRTIRDSWNYDTTPTERTLLAVELRDVSVVTIPAYPDTSVAVRSLEQALSLARGADWAETVRRRIRLAAG